MNALKLGNLYTINDGYVLPDGEWAEWIDGKIYYMSPLAERANQSYFH